MFFPFPILVVLTTKRLMQDLATETLMGHRNGTYGTFRAFYTFGYNRDNTNTRSEQHYFPGNNYQRRLYEEQNSNSDRKQNHYSEFSFSNSNDKWGEFRWNQLITYNNNKDWQSLYIYNEEKQSSNIEKPDALR